MWSPLPQPDFLRPVRPASRLPWAWCVTGLLVLAAAGLDAADAWQQRETALARLAPATAATAPAGPAAQASAATLPPDGTAPRGDAQAARWLQRLQAPWPQVFAAAEQAAVDGVVFTGLGFDALGQLQLEGLAPDAGTALAAAEALRGAAPVAAWQGVRLARLEAEAAAGGTGLRFELVARQGAERAR